MKKYMLLPLLFALFLSFASPTQAAYFSKGENPTLANEIKDDTFVSGQKVSVTAPVAGELFIVGSDLTLTEQPQRSLYAAGSTIDVQHGSGYNAFVAGSTVTLAGTFGHDIYVAASKVVIKEGTVINGDLRLAADTATLHGNVKGTVNLAANQVSTDMTADHTVNADVNDLTFTGGTIGGDLNYTAPKDAAGLDKVKIAGKTSRTVNSDTARHNSTDVFGLATGLTFANWFYRLLASLFLGSALILFFRRKTAEVSEMITANWIQHFVVGLLALLILPIVAVLIVATVIGWKLGLAIFLLYCTWLMIAPTLGLFVVGRWVLNKLGDPEASWWAVLLVGAFLMAAITAIPVLGPIARVVIFFGLSLPALGASLNWLRDQLA